MADNCFPNCQRPKEAAAPITTAKTYTRPDHSFKDCRDSTCIRIPLWLVLAWLIILAAGVACELASFIHG